MCAGSGALMCPSIIESTSDMSAWALPLIIISRGQIILDVFAIKLNLHLNSCKET